MSRSRSVSLVLLKLAMCCPVLSALVFLSIFVIVPGESSLGYLLLATTIYLWPLGALFLLGSVLLGTIAFAAHEERVPWLLWGVVVLLAALVLTVRFQLLSLFW